MGRLQETHKAIVFEKVRQIISLKQNAGCLFEFMAAKFALADNTHFVFRLPSGPVSAASVPSRSIAIGKFEVLPPDWKSGSWRPKCGILYYQNKINLQSVDAFTIIDRELVFFQLTIGSQHSVKAKGLSDIFDLFGPAGDGGMDLVDTCTLIFVVPSDSEMDKAQTLSNAENKVYSSPRKMPSALRHLAAEQFVIKVDLAEAKIPATQ
jgi:hypothetical protein